MALMRYCKIEGDTHGEYLGQVFDWVGCSNIWGSSPRELGENSRTYYVGYRLREDSLHNGFIITSDGSHSLLTTKDTNIRPLTPKEETEFLKGLGLK
ncbi:MAG: hypothetical protein Q8Q35_01590 [Nanoarchaeota archaeon]|nr:hypothetical protein [Nanoarchaeota archaeon]